MGHVFIHANVVLVAGSLAQLNTSGQLQLHLYHRGFDCTNAPRLVFKDPIHSICTTNTMMTIAVAAALGGTMIGLAPRVRVLIIKSLRVEETGVERIVPHSCHLSRDKTASHR